MLKNIYRKTNLIQFFNKISYINGYKINNNFRNYSSLSSLSLPTNNLIGQDYYDNKFSDIVHNELFTNPRWYSAYTPYQSEISQGRLELAYHFQEIIKSITGLDISNHGLLDHSHSLIESIRLIIKHNSKIDFNSSTNSFLNKKYILVDNNIFYHLKKVLNTYENLIFNDVNVHIFYIDFNYNNEYLDNILLKNNVEKKDIIGSIILSSDKFGLISKNYNYINELKQNLNNNNINNFLSVISGDLLHHCYLKSHKELGADIAIGNIQRMGIPLFMGGPHGGYFATNKNLLRLMPGRLINKSVDKYNNDLYRLALQTREQHIKKSSATSNICTNQALLNNYMTAWVIENSKNGLLSKIDTINNIKNDIFDNIKLNDYKNYFFDTFSIKHDNINYNNNINYNVFYHKNGNINNINESINDKIYDKFSKNISITFTDTTSNDSLNYIKKSFSNNKFSFSIINDIYNKHFNNNININSLIRDDISKQNLLNNDIFHKYENNSLEFSRYLKELENKDFSLINGMIPLGSCSMKFNPPCTLNIFSNKDYINIHPFSINTNKMYFNQQIDVLKVFLNNITGFNQCSLQPLAGSHAELTALLMIKKYFRDNNENKRKYVIIPDSAHGTNSATVTVAGLIPIKLKHLSNGKFDLIHLDNLLTKYDKQILCIMITHPSTYGFFDDSVSSVIDKVKKNGGLVYLDGANMNAWIGNLKPADLGFNIMHINMHKTLAIPHGGGGPGVGALCCDNILSSYIPNDNKIYTNSIGNVSSSINGNSLANIISLNYILKIGINNINTVSNKATQNAQYIKNKLENDFHIPYKDNNNNVAHELIIDFAPLIKKTNINVEDISKRFLDFGIHPPTMSWPIENCLMIEPTETECTENLDYLCETLLQIKKEILYIKENYANNDLLNNNLLKNAPHTIQDLMNWDYNYTKNEAFYPLGKKTKKFWNLTNRVNNYIGDRNILNSVK